MFGKLRRAAAAAAMLILVSSVPVQAVTVNFGTAAAVATDNIQNWPKAPATVSETAVLIDADTGAVLYDKGKDEYRYPASTTKLMTLLVAVENASPKEQVTFTETGVRDVNWDSSNIGMKLGETITMKDCWYAAIIESANEVCAQIAENVGGSEAEFINMMNEKAKELGCARTHFANAGGLPDPNHYTTAYDLAKIMRAGLRNSRFRKVVSGVNYTIPATNMSEARRMHTHMPLMARESNLYYEGCIGGKTGSTQDAGHTLVAAAERTGRTYIAVTLRTQDLGQNCTDTTALFDYAFNNFDTIDVNGVKMTVPKGVSVADLTTENFERNGNTYVRYFYNGQFVGYTRAEAATPAVTAAAAGTQTAGETAEGQNAGTEAGNSETSTVSTETDGAQETESTAQEEDGEQEGLSDTAKHLLIAGGCMGVLLIILLIALYIKNG